jgi:hypothetical protein
MRKVTEIMNIKKRKTDQEIKLKNGRNENEE